MVYNFSFPTSPPPPPPLPLYSQHGVAIRSGHHCAQPIHQHLNVGASARASLYIYNTTQEIDAFVEALRDTVDFFTSFKM